MAKQDLRRAGKYRWRIEFLEPVDVVNDFNEKDTEHHVKYTNFPACKVEKNRSSDESNEGNQIQTTLKVEWLIRFIPGLEIDSNWRIKDLFENRIYKIISPVEEVGFRQEYLIKTEFVQ